MTVVGPSNQRTPVITIAICTHNRADLLRETLKSLSRMRWPQAEPCEVLVVSNGCTDNTLEVLEEYADRLPLRWVEESVLGLSHARNRAVHEARGTWIVWTDDDVHVEPDWIEHYLQGMHDYPDASFLGGTIVPRFIGAAPPKWLVRGLPYIATAYAARERWEEPFELTADFLPYGANYAVQRAVHQAYAYRTDLGRVGKGAVLGEEEELLGRLLLDGHRGYWVPQAMIHHLMPPERATFEYLRSYFFGSGQTSMRMASHPPRRWKLWLKALRTEGLYRLALATGRPELWVRMMKKASYRWGQLAAIRAHESAETSSSERQEACQAPLEKAA